MRQELFPRSEQQVAVMRLKRRSSSNQHAVEEEESSKFICSLTARGGVVTAEFDTKNIQNNKLKIQFYSSVISWNR